MSINKQSEIAANLQIGPTDAGMVRIYVEAEGGIELPLDFDPDEAEEIAERPLFAPAHHRGEGFRIQRRLGPRRRFGSDDGDGEGEPGGDHTEGHGLARGALRAEGDQNHAADQREQRQRAPAATTAAEHLRVLDLAGVGGGGWHAGGLGLHDPP